MKFRIQSSRLLSNAALIAAFFLLAAATGCDDESSSDDGAEESTEESSGPTHSVAGEVVDAFGEPLANATVVTVDGDAETETDDEGKFHIEAQGEEMPDLEVYKEGYSMATIEGWPIPSDAQARLYPVPAERGIYMVDDGELTALPITTVSKGSHPTVYDISEEMIAELTLPKGRKEFVLVDVPFENIVSVAPSESVTFGQGGVTLNPIENSLSTRDGDSIPVVSYDIHTGQWAFVSLVQSEEFEAAQVLENDEAVLFTVE